MSRIVAPGTDCGSDPSGLQSWPSALRHRTGGSADNGGVASARNARFEYDNATVGPGLTDGSLEVTGTKGWSAIETYIGRSSGIVRPPASVVGPVRSLQRSTAPNDATIVPSCSAMSPSAGR